MALSRYRGYRGADFDRPFAPFFRPDPAPTPAAVLAAGRAPAGHGYEVTDAAARMRASRGALETGWTRTGSGTLFIACRTDMPGVTAQMWDWWFGWHGTDTARYKLWHPGAHLYSTMADDRSREPGLSDRQRYLGNISHVDELIGWRPTRLAIRFEDPARLGFDDRPGATVICARVGPRPLRAGWLVHQVLPTGDGTVMRSRFFLRLPRPASSLVATDGFARDLLRHCGTEMHHLSGFLPQLYEQFRGTP